jgi:hypothetical protein
MAEVKHHIHQALIKNNCPNCFSDQGLQLDIFQTENDNIFCKKASKEVRSTLYCPRCESEIFPISWDADIERVEAYHRKLAKKLQPNYRLKPLGYAVPALVVVLMAAAVYLLL